MLAKLWAKLLRHRAQIGLATTIVLMTAAIGFASYQRLFSSFAAYDDEGYVMVSLRQFLGGGALYDEVYSQYGPAYYWLASLFYWATDWPVTHDVTRIKTLAVWMAVSLLAAAWLYRVTRSGPFAVIGLLFVALHLERLAMEPGHPQELCVLAVAVCMFLGTFIRGGNTDLRAIAGIGLATALCLMTKVNVGLCLLLSISAALLFVTRSSRIRNLLLGSVLVAMAALPIAVGRHELFSLYGYRLPIVLTIAIAVTSWICIRIEFKPIFGLRHAFCFWGVFALGSIAIATCTVAAGTSLAGLADGILLQHLRFVDAHYHEPPIHALAPLAAFIAVMLARSTLTSAKALRVLHSVAVVLVLGAALRHLVETFQPLYHGSQDRGQAGMLVSFFAASVWVILLPLRRAAVESIPVGRALLPVLPHVTGRSARPTGKTITSPRLKGETNASLGSAERSPFARLSLCLIAILQPLIAYPVPGTQMAIGSLALVIALLTAIHDAIELLRQEGRFRMLAARGAMSSLVGLLLLAVLCRDVYLWTERTQQPPLKLAGAGRLHLPDEFAARERWTVSQLRGRCDTFVCLPSGHNSLYLWSDIEPPTGFNATVWQDLLTDEHQRAIIAALETRERVCIVVEHDEPASLQKHGPLLDFIRENFEPVATYGTREIWQRRTISPAAGSTSGGTFVRSRNVKLGKSRAM